MTMSELRNELKKHGISSTGNKEQLKQRLEQFILTGKVEESDSEEEMKYLNSSNTFQDILMEEASQIRPSHRQIKATFTTYSASKKLKK